MDALFQYFKKFNPVSKEAQKAIAEICSLVTVNKNFIKKGVARIEYFK
jgi:hypothetical protein